MKISGLKFTEVQKVIGSSHKLTFVLMENTLVQKVNNKELIIIFEYEKDDPYLTEGVAWNYNNDEPTKGTHWIHRPLHKYCRDYVPNTYRAIVDCSIATFPKIRKEIVDHWVRFHEKIAQKNRELESFFRSLE